MATAGPNSPGTVTDDGTVGTVAWTNPGNAATSNNTYATALLGAPGFSHYLKCSNYGFSVSGSVSLVELSVERKCAGGFSLDQSIRLLVGGVIVGGEKASPSVWPTSDAVATYSWSSSDLAILGVTVAEINDSTFGVVVAGESDPSDTLSVDSILLTITTTESTGGDMTDGDDKFYSPFIILGRS